MHQAIRPLFDIISAIVASTIALGIILGSGFFMASVAPLSAWEATLTVTFFVWCLATEVWLILTLWQSFFDQPTKYAVLLASRHPRLPALIKPVVALWWTFQLL